MREAPLGAERWRLRRMGGWNFEGVDAPGCRRVLDALEIPTARFARG
ncbi:hypothetical protein [Solidesulfovibrio magneticus]|nr:hypothetical protein [Solidesulfovibrio magneticus]